MIPVLGVPYIARSDLFTETILSIDEPVGDIIIIDNSANGTCPQIDGAHHVRMFRNIGVAAAWNLIIKSAPKAPWWAIINSDLRFQPGDLARLATAMQDHDFVLLNSMACFAVSQRAIQTIGWFDERFCPAYCEDNDFVYRARLLGIEPHFELGHFAHYGSATIKSDTHMRDENDRTYAQNVREYIRKWGGIMGKEVYKTPYDEGGSPRDCKTLDMERLNELSWS